MTKQTYRLYFIVLIALVIILPGSILFYAKTKASRFSLKVMENQQHWEYVIYKGNRPFIHQTCVPAVQGRIYFKDKRSARAVGNIVIEKLEKDQSPAISISELKALGIR